MAFSIFKDIGLEGKLTLLIGGLFFVPLVIVSVYISRYITTEYHSVYGHRATNVATFVAASPDVVAALAGGADEKKENLRRQLDALLQVTQVSYIVPRKVDGTPLLGQASEPYRLYAHVQDMRGGASEVSDFRGLQGGTVQIDGPTLSVPQSFSQQAVAPVTDISGKQIGSVAVGLLHDDVDGVLSLFTLPLQKIMLGAMILGLVLAILLARSVKKILLGFEPDEIAAMLQQQSAMLQTMTEGVLAVDAKGRVTLVNHEAERILRKTGEAHAFGQSAYASTAHPALKQRLEAALQSGEPEFDDEQDLSGVTVLANYMPVTVGGVVTGAVCTFRDMSEVRRLAERITDINRYVDALRSQSHEFLNKLHVIMGLVASGKLDVLKNYIESLVDSKTREDKTIHDTVKDPVIAGFLGSKFSNARELGVAMHLAVEGTLPLLAEARTRDGFITILGNIIDNALDAMRESPRKSLDVSLAVREGCACIAISDTGPGMDEATMANVYLKNFSTKGSARGLGLWLVKRTVDTLKGTISVHSAPGEGARFDVCLPLPQGGDAKC